MTVSLAVAAEGHTPALLLRPWQAADMPGLLAAMDHDYPSQGLRPHPDVDAGPVRWTGPRDDHEASIWLSGQDRGWRVGDWLTLAVLGQQGRVLGQVGLTNRAGGRIGNGGFGEIHYWTAAEARGLGIASSAARAIWEISPANPPLWHTSGHVHVAASRPGIPIPASLVRSGG